MNCIELNDRMIELEIRKLAVTTSPNLYNITDD